MDIPNAPPTCTITKQQVHKLAIKARQNSTITIDNTVHRPSKIETMYLKAEAALLAHATAWILNVQRTYGAMRHASEASNICLNVSVPSLTLPPTWLPMTPVTADNTKMILEYSLEKEQIRSEILAEALASAMDLGRGLMLEVDGRCSTNTNVKEIEAVEMEARASAYTRAWWMKWWMSLEMVPWPYDGKGKYFEATCGNADENENEEETEALAYTRDTIATPYEYNTNNNIEPSQGQQHALNKPKDETNTITFRSAANATTPPNFIAVVIGVVASIFCLLPSSHSGPDNEMMPPLRPVPEPERFQPLPFERERNQAVRKRPQSSNQQEPTAADTEKPTWSRYKGKDPASNPPVSEWTAITSGRKGKGPVPPSFVLDRTSIPNNRRGKGPEAPRPSEQPDDGADQMWKIPFDRKGKGPAPPSPIPERTSSNEADACRLSKTLGKAYSTGRVPAEMMKKRSEELLQEAYALGWGLDVKAEKPSRVSRTKGDTEGLWLDWEEEPTPNSRHRHRVPAMPSSLESTTVPPSEAEKPSRVSPPEGDTKGLWLDWDEPEPEPIPRHRHSAGVAASTLEPTRTSPPEAETIGLGLEGPPVPEHITPVTSLDSGLDLEIMPGSYADPSQDTPRPQFTPVFGSSTAPSQQLQVIAPPPSPPRRPFYSLPNAQLHGRDVVALRSYPQEDDECIPLVLERYLFAQIRPPFLHDHNNIVGPRVLAHTRPRCEVQMRRIERTASRAHEGKGLASRTFEEMDVELEEAESGEDESYADDLRETWGQGARGSWF